MRKNVFKINDVTVTNLRELASKPHRSFKEWRAAQREANAYTRIFVEVTGETVLENLVKRRVRPVAEWRKLMPEVLEKAGIDPQKVRWSQYAGCSCPCSPGFICTESVGKRVWVEVSSRQ